jgi:hypothetical protein
MNAPDAFLTLNLGEAEVRVPREAAVMAYLEQQLDRARPLTVGLSAFVDRVTAAEPAIGAAHQGGVYAGRSLHEGRAVELVLLPGDRDEITWPDAVAWAEEQGGTLPSRIDQIVLFKNLKSEFEGTYYWSGEHRADDERWAWSQHFSDGGQDYGDKVTKLRARAVRRLPI